MSVLWSRVAEHASLRSQQIGDLGIQMMTGVLCAGSVPSHSRSRTYIGPCLPLQAVPVPKLECGACSQTSRQAEAECRPMHRLAAMSFLEPAAHTRVSIGDVRFGSKADIWALVSNVRSYLKSGHSLSPIKFRSEVTHSPVACGARSVSGPRSVACVRIRQPIWKQLPCGRPNGCRAGPLAWRIRSAR